MKKLHVFGLVTSVALCFPLAAQASDGTITFTGKITAQTCTVNGGAGTFTVALPTVSTAALAAPNATAGATNFSINVTACDAKNPVAGYTAYFEANSNIDSTTGKLKNTVIGGAQLVQIELLNAGDSSVIDLSKPTTSQKVTLANVTNNAGTSNFIARYFATGLSSSGDVSSQVTYSIVYQ